MLSIALPSLRTFFRPILRLLGMSSPPHEAEFPVGISVEDWLRCLLERYCSRDPTKSAKDRSRMESLKVTTIRRYKEKKNGEHEYLVAEVSVPDMDQPRYLHIERTVKDPLSMIGTTERSSLRPQAICTHSSQSSVLVSKEFPACDNVKTMEAWPTDDICISHINCKNAAPIILLDLAIVAEVVHNHSKKYQLIKRQCFWYSDMIVAVLQKKFPWIQVVCRDASVEADHAATGEEIEVFNGLSGTFMTAPFYSRQNSAVEEIQSKFDESSLSKYASVYLLNSGIFLMAKYHF